MKFRKKAIVIDAIRVSQVISDARDAWGNLPDWFRNAYNLGGIVITPDFINVPTLEGVMQANIGDWIIQGIKGEIYPCKPDIFEATYELV